MNLPFNQNVLIKSPSLRTSALSNLDDSRAEEALSKAKAIVFALWNGEGWATVEHLAQYFQSSIPGIKHIYVVKSSKG